ncbi:DUF350 domain-containing protein [Chengkuizengella axinellae]|uniref:DUF350 domain-containing protein n=1 Tax=Chengkuizengella axinellae TaxID=3064388 RepID=A0ABT9J551_9BACL|nr:DUF350 domain-containing protein [Chengkuizengella sp. 2205SS18-9]MDP5276587.1 DUF350 domain-containing protein [Chengkuizengella sp. 2205SS18-9]
MNQEIDALLEHPFMETIAYFSVAALALIIFLAIFELVTSYRSWDEILNGNIAVSLTIGGKIIAICNIFRFAEKNHESFYVSFVTASFGFVLLILAYFLFEFLTPYIKVDEEIQKDNRAVGFIAMIISISLSYVIGACIN